MISRQQPRPLPSSPGFVVGRGEALHLGAGWWDRVAAPDRPGLWYRPTHASAVMRIMGAPGQRRLHLLLSASLTLIGGPARLEVLCGGGDTTLRTLGLLEITWEDWAVHSLECPVSEGGPMELTLHTLTPCVPHRVLRNGDHREMGVNVAAVRLG